MAQEEKDIKNAEVDLDGISLEEIIKNYDEILKSRAPIWRKKKGGQFATIPTSKLELYLGGQQAGGIQFYIEKDWRSRISGKISVFEQKHEDVKKEEKKAIAPPKDIEFDKKIKIYRQMSLKDRQASLNDNIEQMNKKVELYDKIDASVIKEIVDIVSNVWQINKTSMQEHKNSAENSSIPDMPDLYLDRLVEKTNILVDSIVTLLSKDKFKFSDLKSIEDISTGSVTLNHINRVVLRFIPYIIFYNEFFKAGKISRIRAKFDEKFMHYYKRTDISLETIFKDGIRRLTNKEMHAFSLGALLHDIGKFPHIDYTLKNDREERKKIMTHAPFSYNMITKTKRFSMDAGYMALLHHEYYGDPIGYNFTVQLFPKLSTKFSGSNLTNYYISADITDLKEGRAIAFFSAKLLEIVDVFDELVARDKDATGGGHTIGQALKIMMDEYIYKNLRLDPVLFYIFIEFLKEYVGKEQTLNADFF